MAHSGDPLSAVGGKLAPGCSQVDREGRRARQTHDLVARLAERMPSSRSPSTLYLAHLRDASPFSGSMTVVLHAQRARALIPTDVRVSRDGSRTGPARVPCWDSRHPPQHSQTEG